MPTMWRPKEKHYQRMLPLFNDHPLVGEIIIIDNDITKADPDIINLSKVVYLPQEKNIYTHPSWNLGVKHAKHDKILLHNDDCLANIKSLEMIYDQITPDKGLIGYSALSYCIYTIDQFDIFAQSGFGDDILIEELNPADYPSTSGMPHMSYGCMMYFHKDSFYETPKELKIYYGDLFLYLMNLKNGKQNYQIENGFVMTQMSATVNSIGTRKDALSPIDTDEHDLLRPVFNRYGLSNFKYRTVLG